MQSSNKATYQDRSNNNMVVHGTDKDSQLGKPEVYSSKKVLDFMQNNKDQALKLISQNMLKH